MPPSHTCVAAGKSDRTDKPRHRIRFVIFLRRKQKFGSHHFRPSTQAIATLSPRPANPRPHETKRRIRMQGSLASQIFDATRGQSATRQVAAPRNCIVVVVLTPFTTPFSLYCSLFLMYSTQAISSHTTASILKKVLINNHNKKTKRIFTTGQFAFNGTLSPRHAPSDRVRKCFRHHPGYSQNYLPSLATKQSKRKITQKLHNSQTFFPLDGARSLQILVY